MLYVGDLVSHNTFPPIEGYVAMIQPMKSGVNNIGVYQKGIDKIYYDTEDTWDIVQATPIIDTLDDDNCIVIDVDYREIKTED